MNCCVCGLPAEGIQECTCLCPRCGVHVFDDVTIPDHGMCYDCFQEQRNEEDEE